VGRLKRERGKLDAILEDRFSLEGVSIKSILSMAAKGTTSPSALTRRDIGADAFDLLLGLTEDEVNEVREYYVWRQIGEAVTRLAARARQEARNRSRKRKFKTGMKEIERRYHAKKKARQ